MTEPSYLQGPTRAPTAEEQDYYYGLPSRPKLVAKSSIVSYTVVHDNWPIAKILDPVRDHSIIPLWNDPAGSLRQEVVEALEHLQLQWLAIDVLRFGDDRVIWTTSEEPYRPVTLFVSVEPDSTTWEIGYSAALECREILRRHGMDDVEVEIKESELVRCNAEAEIKEPEVVRCAAPKLSRRRIAEPPEWHGPFSEFLGVSIASLSTPSHQGTKGLYLRLRGTDRILALTCRHVVFDDTVENEDYHHDDASPHAMIQPGEVTFNKAVRDVTLEIAMWERSIERNDPEKRPSPEAECQRLDAEKEKLKWQELLQRLEPIRKPADRVFGHLLFSPKYALAECKSGAKRLRDWALIELDPDKHESPMDSLGNRVMSGHRISGVHARVEASMLARKEGRECALSLDFHTETFNLRGTSQFEQVPALVVGKYGSGTGLTFGLANEAKSVVRTPPEPGSTANPATSEAWCILGPKKDLNTTREPFSAPGDSGACVWDTEGRIAGMMTGGTKWPSKNRKGLDVAYATPIEWLLDDIRGYGFDVELCDKLEIEDEEYLQRKRQMQMPGAGSA